MTWWEAQHLAKAGTPVRRRAWSADGGMVLKTIVFIAGAGTTRSVAAVRNAGTSETVVVAGAFGAADFLADDWEVAP